MMTSYRGLLGIVELYPVNQELRGGRRQAPAAVLRGASSRCCPEKLGQ